MTTGINWLASYPKSGNTWVRIFFINLLYPHLSNSIDQLGFIRHAASRSLFDEFSDIMSSDLTSEEILEMRPKVYSALKNAYSPPIFLKIHDAFQTLTNQEILISKAASQSIIYIIRNPLDVAVSFSEFKQVGIDQVIEEMADQTNMLSKPSSQRLTAQLPQLLGSWSQHVKNWTQQTAAQVKVIRYEDLLDDAFVQFKNMVKFVGLSFSDEAIKIAIEKSNFSSLQEQEQKVGFPEKYTTTSSFFRKGIAGQGMKIMSPQQVHCIKREHEEVMKLYHYL